MGIRIEMDQQSIVLPKPSWLKIKPAESSKYKEVKSILTNLKLVTVCEEAHCPNINECWSGGTATMMVMGDTCTRGCRFCNVKTAKSPLPLDPNEPEKLAQAIKQMNLSYVVITSVDRDDLEDQGASHFAKCIEEVRTQSPQTKIEVLIPDFRGREDLLKIIIDAKPDVLAHNLETVRSLQKTVRDNRAGYDQSLSVLKFAKQHNLLTKSSIMLGLGETAEELQQAFTDLRAAGVDFLTLGQYMRPSQKHLEVKEYVHPDIFQSLKVKAESLGFRYVVAGPFVRSSYRAGEFFIKAMCK